MADHVCPDCGRVLGANRYQCRTCNRFNSGVIRVASRRLRQKYPNDYAALKADAADELAAKEHDQ